jgi:hypothetical protein
MRPIAITSASKPNIAINASQRAIRARTTPYMTSPPTSPLPSGRIVQFRPISRGEIGTGIRRCTDKLMTRRGASLPTSPSCRTCSPSRGFAANAPQAPQAPGPRLPVPHTFPRGGSVGGGGQVSAPGGFWITHDDCALMQCCWHVRYQFCGLSAEITVYAEKEDEARAKAVDQLRSRGLKVA